MPRKRLRTQRRNAVTSTHLTRTVHRTEMGKQLYPSPDPPPWTQSPWWSQTLSFYAEQSAVYTARSIYLLLLEALGIKEQYITIRIRVQSVRIWGLSRQAISLGIYRVNAIGSIIKLMNDRGSQVNYSRLGWHYGLDSRLSIAHDKKTPVFSVSGEISKTSRLLIYVELLFQNSTQLEPTRYRLSPVPGVTSLNGFSFNDPDINQVYPGPLY